MGESQTIKNKGKHLFLLQYLVENTDEEHAVSTADLIQAMRDKGFKGADRHTVKDDIDTLIEYGCDIIVDVKGNKNTYYIGRYMFDRAELRVMIDALYSAKAISVPKTKALVNTLLETTSKYNRAFLDAKACMDGHLKTSNPMVMQNVDIISRAIVREKKIAFRYYDYSAGKKRIQRRKGHVYHVSPYSLIWDSDRYYLAGRVRENTLTFRVDRMCDVTELDETAERDESFDAAGYAKRTVSMYDGGQEEQEVTLVCKNELMQNVIDRFGENIRTSVLDDEEFQAVITVRPSRTFFAWVFGFCGGIRIIGPDFVCSMFQNMLNDVLLKQTAATSLPF